MGWEIVDDQQDDQHPDPRRRVPRTDAVLADPRLTAAQRRLDRALVRQAVGRAQQRVRTTHDASSARQG